MREQNPSDKKSTETSRKWIARPSIVVLISITAISLGGCSSTGGFRYIEPSRKDRLTDGTAKQILEHNEFCDAQRNCKKPGEPLDLSPPNSGLFDLFKRN